MANYMFRHVITATKFRAQKLVPRQAAHGGREKQDTRSLKYPTNTSHWTHQKRHGLT